MSVETLLKRLAVPPVPSGSRAQGTGKPFTEQCGSLGSLGSLEKDVIPGEKADRTPAGSPPAEPAPDTTARRQWHIVEPDGTAWKSSFAPPQTLAEVLAGYPPGTVAEPIEGVRQPPPGDGLARQAYQDQDATVPLQTPPQAVQRALVRCGDCTHWRADTIGDGTGIGSCLVSAPASKRPGSLWPNSPHRCQVWEGASYEQR